MCTHSLHLINLELLNQECQLVLRIEVHDKNEPKEPTPTTKILILLLSRRPGKIPLRLRVSLFPEKRGRAFVRESRAGEGCAVEDDEGDTKAVEGDSMAKEELNP